MECNNEIQEVQILEHNLQNLLMQKQAFQIELSENSSALKEINNSGEEVYKVIGQLMIKTEKKRIKEELEKKEKIINLRIKNLEKQEISLTSQLKELREKILSSKN